MRFGISMRIRPGSIRAGNQAIKQWKRNKRREHGFWYNLFHLYY